MQSMKITLFVVSLTFSMLTEYVSIAESTTGVQKTAYGKMPDGVSVEAYTLTNPKGLKAEIITYGATLARLSVPDRKGKLADIVLGCNSLEEYLQQTNYFGCIVGRVGNRIAAGKFTLDGKDYTLATNNGPNHLHGGIKGFDKRVWNAEPVENPKGQAVRFTYESADGEEGYPGTLKCAVTYILTKDNALEIDYEASTDKTTIVNLTHHSYFNLAATGDILGHELMINATRYTPVDDTSIPTGDIAAVAGTPFDFTKAKSIGKEIEKLAGTPGGYDHNFALEKPTSGEMTVAAELYDPTTGRLMRLRTTEPGVQFYSGNYLDGTVVGKAGQAYQIHTGLCLETQHFPDAINHPNFPSIVLKPGVKFTSSTVHEFSTR
jgi:aldose 1-epimerase